MFFLSLWKTYLGPALAAPFGFTYIEMLLYTLSAAMLSTLLMLRYARHINHVLARVLPRRNNRPVYNPKLRKYLLFWRRYGFYGVMFLAPLLIGIPIAVWLAARLGTPARKITVFVAVFTVWWASLSYVLATRGIAIFGTIA